MDPDLADLLPEYYCIPLRCGNQNSSLCQRICTHLLYMVLATTICLSGFFYYQTHYLNLNTSTPAWGSQFQPKEPSPKIENIPHLPPKINLESLYEQLSQNSESRGKCNEESIRQLMRGLESLSQEVSNLKEWKKNLKEGLPNLVMKQNELIEENVEHALEIYSADEIGLMDYAAFYSGGGIESISKNTKPFPTYRPWSVFKVFQFEVLSSPEEILKTNTLPGNCFAFEESTAEIKIKLAGPVRIGSVTLSHASKILLGEDGMKSAPKDFQVFGYVNPTDLVPVYLGQFAYDIHLDQHQTFIIDENYSKNQPFQYVQLDIVSNHGKREFTCVYRFRVHGQPADDFKEQKGCIGCKRKH